MLKLCGRRGGGTAKAGEDGDGVGRSMIDLISETKVKQSPSAHQSNFVSGDVSVSAEKEKDLTSKNSDGFISFTLKPSESQVCDWILVRCL